MSSTSGGQNILASRSLNKIMAEQKTSEESEVLDSDRNQLIAGQRISIIKSILQKMLILQSDSSSESMEGIQWT